MPIEGATSVDELNAANPLVGESVGEGDDHIRMLKQVLKNCFPGLDGAAFRRVAKAANYTVTPQDTFVLFDCTATMVLNMQAAATLGNHVFAFYVRGASVQLDPNGAELINGVSSIVYVTGTWGLVYCNGTDFLCLTNSSLPANSVFESTIADNSITLPKLSTTIGGALTDETLTEADKVIFADTSDSSQLKKGTLQLVPSGTVISFAGSAAPTGYLKCDGAAVSRTTYASLFSAIGTTFGSGDGSTTFNLPELRGEFIRGLDDGRGVDTGRTLGSAQVDAFKSHTHTYTSPKTPFSGNGTSGPGSGTSDKFPTTNGATTVATGSTETRPRNIALLYCIKT